MHMRGGIPGSCVDFASCVFQVFVFAFIYEDDFASKVPQYWEGGGGGYF